MTHREWTVFRGQIPWRFSLSKINISPAAPDSELILFPLWYWPVMNAHAKQQQDKVFETDFIDSQKPNPFAHLLALSHIWYNDDGMTRRFCLFQILFLGSCPLSISSMESVTFFLFSFCWCVCTFVSFVGNLDHLKRVRHSSHKSSATHCSQRAQDFPVSRQWCGCQCWGVLMCVHMLMHAIASVWTLRLQRVCTGSWLWEKNPLPHWGL